MKGGRSESGCAPKKSVIISPPPLGSSLWHSRHGTRKRCLSAVQRGAMAHGRKILSVPASTPPPLPPRLPVRCYYKLYALARLARRFCCFLFSFLAISLSLFSLPSARSYAGVVSEYSGFPLRMPRLRQWWPQSGRKTRKSNKMCKKQKHRQNRA